MTTNELQRELESRLRSFVGEPVTKPTLNDIADLLMEALGSQPPQTEIYVTETAPGVFVPGRE